MHGVLGMESLSAGAWYVAIDFQLYALMVALLWLAGRCASPRGAGLRHQLLMPALVLAGVLASLCHFNLDAGWDNWAPYFFGSYGLGVLAWWISDPQRQHGAARWAWVLAPALLGLMLEFRSRIAVAALVACVLVLFGRARRDILAGSATAALNRLGTMSFSLFLVHFPVLLLINAAFVRFVPADPVLQAGGMVLAWLASLAAGALFYRWVEAPLGRLLGAAARPITPRAAGLLRFVPVIPARPLLALRRAASTAS
jgi:peptidoglycan/LPS O-acetylase OafA/YrhL